MLEELKNTFFRNMPKAYAMHKFIEDNEGNPCDYIFLDVNFLARESTKMKEQLYAFWQLFPTVEIIMLCQKL